MAPWTDDDILFDSARQRPRRCSYEHEARNHGIPMLCALIEKYPSLSMETISQIADLSVETSKKEDILRLGQYCTTSDLHTARELADEEAMWPIDPVGGVWSDNYQITLEDFAAEFLGNFSNNTGVDPDAMGWWPGNHIQAEALVRRRDIAGRRSEVDGLRASIIISDVITADHISLQPPAALV